MAFQSATVRLTLVPSRSPSRAFNRTLRLESTLASRGPAPTQGPPEQAACAEPGKAKDRPINNTRDRASLWKLIGFALRFQTPSPFGRGLGRGTKTRNTFTCFVFRANTLTLALSKRE